MNASDGRLPTPPSRPDETVEGFYGWEAPPAELEVSRPVEADALRRLGPSPFERGFPLVGFLATVYEKTASAARERLQPRGG